MSAAAGEVWADDPAHHEQLVCPWTLCHSPLQRGAFGYRLRFLRLPGVTLYRERFDLRCRLLGLSPAEQLVISIPVTARPRSTYWGRPQKASRVPAMLPGELDVTLDGGQAQVIALIERSALWSHLPDAVAQTLERAAAMRFLRAGPTAVSRVGRRLVILIDRAIARPGMLAHPRLRRALAGTVLRELSSLVDVSAETRPPRPTVRRQGLDRALAFLREADWSRVTIPEVAEAACVSQRTLEYAFREAFDLTPVALIKRCRLHAARRDLSRKSHQRTTVTDVAFRHGFHHLARFSTDYRRSFGESPTETLRRSRRIEGDLAPLLG